MEPNANRPAALFLIVALAMFVACAFSPRMALAFCQTRAKDGMTSQECLSDGVPLAWTRPCMAYALNMGSFKDLSEADVRGALSRSFETWQQVQCGDAGTLTGIQTTLLDFASTCSEATYNGAGPNQNTIFFVKNWQAMKYDAMAYATTTVWYGTQTGEIFDVDMAINQTRATYRICPATGCTEPGTADLQNIITHEAGHFFGLAHPDPSKPGAQDATMYGKSEDGEVKKRSLTQDDANGFCYIYTGGQLTKACNSVPEGGLAIDCGNNNGDTGGCAINDAKSAKNEHNPRLLWALGILLFAFMGYRLRRRP